MSRKVIKIPQAKQNAPIETQRLRVAAYCRVSTRHEEQYHSLEAQITYYTNYIKRNPNWKFVAVYSDVASGVRAANRPGYQQLMRDCTSRKTRFDPGEVSQPFWSGCVGNYSPNQEIEANEHRCLH